MSNVLLQVSQVSKSYGPLKILDEVTVTFGRSQKVGMIGRNGAGKSTLCKIITGEEEADQGKIVKNSELKLSYLEQHDPFEPDETVADFLNRYTGKEEWECARVAWDFQIMHDHFMMPIGSLSGGYQTRVKLAAMLLRDPNFLILDEPTNFLDLHTQLLLENFLKSFRGGFIIVSHDREFLKKTCDHTLEVDQGDATPFPGNIEEYFAFKQVQLEQKMSYNRGLEKKKKQLQDFVDRFRAKASKATQAKSKMKQLARMETIGIDQPMDTVRIHIPAVEVRQGAAMRCHDLAIGYAEKTVASGIGLEIDRGSKIAVLGDNGQGKTTFLRTIAADLEAREGSVTWAQGLSVAYYAQHVYRGLSGESTVMGYLEAHAAQGVTRQEILNLAGAFLFQGDDVEKRVGVLSGGERARLVLAGLLLGKSHVLILDEPTNHLDFETVEALGRALKAYQGTVFFASHDRTFVSLMATQILDMRGGSLRRYPGTYQDYVDFLTSETMTELYGKQSVADKGRKGGQKEAQRGGSKGKQTEADPEEKARQDAQRKHSEKLKSLEAKISRARRRVEEFEKKKESLIGKGKVNPFYFSKQQKEKMKEYSIRLEEEEDNLSALMRKFEKLQKRNPA